MKLGRRILIVEDEPELWREEFEKVFPDPDWQITFAETSRQAICLFKEHLDIDILLVDYNLKGGDNGREFLKNARDIDKNIPIFLFSGITNGGGFSANDIQSFQTIHHFISKDEVMNSPKKFAEIIQREYIMYMAKMCTPKVHSEFGNLRSVLVHTPSEELCYIDPDHLSWYLFESRPDLASMQKQHTDFIKKLKITAHRPIVLEVGLLLFDVIKNSNYEERRLIIENILLNRELQNLMKCFNQYKLNLSQILKEKIDELCECDARKITLDLLRGINIADFLLENSDPSLFTRKGCQVIQPIPNLYFTRDPAFALGDSIILGRMYWPIRKREPSIFREIIMRHPFMASAKPTLMDWNTQKDETFFVEGGDVMAIENGTYVIAESERTTRQSIRKIVTELFKRESAKCIYQPVIPAKRAFIHLDTVCSLVGSDKVIVHPEAIKAYGTTLKWTPENMSDGEFIPEFHHETLTEILEKKHGKTLIETAGGGPSARLEQFDDATNVFMVNDKKAIVYDRNRYTNLVLQSFVDTAEFSGPDLVMGRGGPRCMTMPLNRD